MRIGSPLLQSAAALGHAVLANGPILAGKPGLFGLVEDVGKIIGKVKAGVAGGGSFTKETCVFGPEFNGGSGLLGWIEHDVGVVRIERRLKESAVYGVEKCLRI